LIKIDLDLSKHILYIMNLPNASKEQIEVVDLITQCNLVVDSVAGSGKTTCNLHIAKRYPHLNILLLTYNSKLKMETRQKIRDLELSNIEAHSYHSFCVKYYNRICYNDTVIQLIIDEKSEPIKEFGYDIIIVDETQDMTILYFELFCKLYRDNTTPDAKICILGDQKQSIFGFKGADERFITFADHIFLVNNFMWKRCTLSQSFRITMNMAHFINKCMLGYDRMRSAKNPGELNTTYLICRSFGFEPFKYIQMYLNMGYEPDDIFVLAPSLRNSSSPARVLENNIKNRLPGVSVFVPVSDDEKLDPDVLANKIVFSTFHQVKGLERKVVIVYSFDDSYFKFYKKDISTEVCPNELYVACTRASERMLLIHDCNSDYLPFIDQDKISRYSDFQVAQQIAVTIKKDKCFKVSVTNVIRHIRSDVIDLCYSFLSIDHIRTGNAISISSKTAQGGGFENVSEITGTAVPSYFEYLIKGQMTIFEILQKDCRDKKYHQPELDHVDTSQMDMFFGPPPPDTDSSDEDATKAYDILTINMATATPDQILFIANSWLAYKGGWLFKIKQITEYDWLTVNHMKSLIPRFNKLKITKRAIFEEHVKARGSPELLNRELSGYIDCTNGNDVYEFKCTNKVEKEHFLQLALYMYLKNDDTKNYYMHNIINDGLYKVSCSQVDLVRIVELIFRDKYLTKTTLSDAQFNVQALDIATSNTSTPVVKKTQIINVIEVKPLLFDNSNVLSIIIYDFETTGSNFREENIFQIGALQIFYNNATKAIVGTTYKTFTSYIKSVLSISWRSTLVTGASNETIANAKPFVEVFTEFLNWIIVTSKNVPVVLLGHNSNTFDFNFWLYEMVKNDMDVVGWFKKMKLVGICDLLVWLRSKKPKSMSGKLFPLSPTGKISYSLSAMFKVFFPDDTLNHHEADADCIATYKIIAELLKNNLNPIVRIDCWIDRVKNYNRLVADGPKPKPKTKPKSNPIVIIEPEPEPEPIRPKPILFKYRPRRFRK
jgi:DNA polymerase III epsilon subunit-like protein